jgi:hypothetical protein
MFAAKCRCSAKNKVNLGMKGKPAARLDCDDAQLDWETKAGQRGQSRPTGATRRPSRVTCVSSMYTCANRKPPNRVQQKGTASASGHMAATEELLSLLLLLLLRPSTNRHRAAT